jgi:hypothetical protein
MGSPSDQIPGHSRVMAIERESETQITYELGNGVTRTIQLDSSFADFVMEAWERFLSTPGESDSPGG